MICGGITKQEALHLAEVTCGAARDEGLELTVAIVDPAGHLLVLTRMDAAFPGSVEPAIAKARCAALFRRPTSAFSESQKAGIPVASLPGVIPLGGGIPLSKDGTLLGAIGLSGAVETTETALAERIVSDMGYG